MKLYLMIFVALSAATNAAEACRPISPGSAVFDCRTEEQIEQARTEEAKAKAGQERAAEARVNAERDRTQQKQRSAPQVAKGSNADPAELIGCRVTLTKF